MSPHSSQVRVDFFAVIASVVFAVFTFRIKSYIFSVKTATNIPSGFQIVCMLFSFFLKKKKNTTTTYFYVCIYSLPTILFYPPSDIMLDLLTPSSKLHDIFRQRKTILQNQLQPLLFWLMDDSLRNVSQCIFSYILQKHIQSL